MANDDPLTPPPVQPIADLGFAQLDLDRQRRCGFPEVIYGPGKTPDQLQAIVARLHQAEQGCLVTRLSDDQASVLESAYPTGEYDAVGRTFWLPANGAVSQPQGRVLVLTAGTSDRPVALEAVATARAMGCAVELLVDVGVAGLHRLLAQVERLRQADCLVVVAGMEGALPSVVGGLVAVPVIAVPTSVGYGANLGGMTALLGMLSSCAANVACVNIDGGFCGGYLAGMIARRTAAADSPK